MEGGLEPDNLKGLPPRHRWHRNKIQGLSTTPRAPFVAAPTIRLAFAAGTARVISVTFLPAAHLVSSPSDVERTTRALRHKTSVLGLTLNVLALAELGDSPAPAGPGDSADSLDPADSFVSRGGASPITSTCAPGTASCAPTSTGTCTSRSLAARSAAIAALVIEAVQHSALLQLDRCARADDLGARHAVGGQGAGRDRAGREVVGGNDLARADRARDDEHLLARLGSGAKHAESQGRSGAEAQGDHEMTVPP